MLLSSTSALNFEPQRILSLVPSQTELLSHLGLEDHIAGITKFCVHPAGLKKNKAIVGGTKNVQLEHVRTLRPDLIIANKEENVREQVQELAREFPVWVTDVDSLEGALSMIGDIGKLTRTEPLATNLVHAIQAAFQFIEKPALPINTAYLIWKDPYMSVGGDTFINDLLGRCGLINIFRDASRYPVIDINELNNKGCQLCLLSTEPYPFKEHHLQELLAKLPGVKLALADGEFFSWYGSRLLDAPTYFNQLLAAIGSWQFTSDH